MIKVEDRESLHFIGVDVGTGSARAGIFNGAGSLVASAKRDIALWREGDVFAEQSSDDIWRAVTASIREALDKGRVDPFSVKGIGFDATCSLVLLDKDFCPLPAGTSSDSQRNIIVWMDHRAIDQAHRINASGHPVLRYVGGTLSPEMQTPKILWLKENLPQTFNETAHFFDLADFLTFRATGSLQRSGCTVTCKWTYLAHEQRWDESYFLNIGLEELAKDNFSRIGSEVVNVATPIRGGLSAIAASELGLPEGTVVAAGVIDAHCGAIGTLFGSSASHADGQMALIMGTSACAMTQAEQPIFVEGIWGPYFGAIVPGEWLLEGGQSAYGAALDHLVKCHPGYLAADSAAKKAGQTLLNYLEMRAVLMTGSTEEASLLHGDIHVVPEFLGNRAPFADPAARALIAGLTLDDSEANLVSLYVAGLAGLCYGTRQIVEAERERGVDINSIVVSGGASRSCLLKRLLADATGLTVLTPSGSEPVLLGGAICASVAAGVFANVRDAAFHMTSASEITAPSSSAILRRHDLRYSAFLLLQDTDRRLRSSAEEARN